MIFKHHTLKVSQSTSSKNDVLSRSFKLHVHVLTIMIKNKLKGVTTFAQQHIQCIILKNCNKYYNTNANINMTQIVRISSHFALSSPIK